MVTCHRSGVLNSCIGITFSRQEFRASTLRPHGFEAVFYLMKMKSSSVLSAVLSLAGATFLIAGTDGFYAPGFRGAEGSRYSLWETFTVPTGAPGNKPNSGSDSSAVLTQSTPGAFLTGSGNIYNMSALSTFSISYSAGGPVGNVVLQARTFGMELDYDAIRLNYDGGSLSSVRKELDRLSVGDPGQPGSGAYVSSAWTWDLSGMGVNNYTITFSAKDPSVSFDSATLDTQVVPEPTTFSLAAVGLGVLVWGLRRRL